MTDKDAKVHISLRDGVLELEGSESFVTDQLRILQPLIQKAFEASPPSPKNGSSGQAEQATQKAGGGAPTGLGAFENVFAEADGKIQILKTLPGSNKSQKAVNAALLLAYANTLKGQESTSHKDIRDLCSAHACLDRSNFSTTMKSQKESFLVTGTGASQSVKLTVPGKKKAEELAQQLNQ